MPKIGSCQHWFGVFVSVGHKGVTACNTNYHQGKALKEGCHEGECAWTSVSSREKTNTKRNLARAMTESKSEMQTVTNGCVSQRAMN